MKKLTRSATKALPCVCIVHRAAYNFMRQVSTSTSSLTSGGENKESSNASQEDVKKLIKVTVVGDPNAGKSTLINCLLGRNINSASKKVHTTRRNMQCVLNVGNTQMVFVDTPGLINKKSLNRFNLEKPMLVDPYLSLSNIDVAIVLKDASDFYTKHKFSDEVEKVFSAVEKTTKTILALNKIDLIRDKTELLSLTKLLVQPLSGSEQLRKSDRVNMNKLFDRYDRKLNLEDHAPMQGSRKAGPRFDEVFMVSALKSIGVDKLKNYLISQAYERDWLYDGGYITDQSMEDVVKHIVKGQLLELISEEIPYRVNPMVDLIREDEDGELEIHVSMNCTSKRLASSVMGKGGETIRSIALSSEQLLSNAFERTVVLKLLIRSNR